MEREKRAEGREREDAESSGNRGEGKRRMNPLIDLKNPTWTNDGEREGMNGRRTIGRDATSMGEIEQSVRIAGCGER